MKEILISFYINRAIGNVCLSFGVHWVVHEKSKVLPIYITSFNAEPSRGKSSLHIIQIWDRFPFVIIFFCCCYHFNDINSRVCFFLALHFSLFLFTLSLTHSLCIDLYRANTVIFRDAATKHHKISWHFAQLVTSKKKKSSLAVHTLVDMVNGRVLEHHK